MTQIDLSFVDQTVHQLGGEPEAVVPILQAIQEHYRYLPEDALRRVCELTDITPATVTGVSTFYRRFRHRPVGRHIVHICHGTACHVKGSGLIQDALAHHLGLAAGEDTDAEGRFTVEGEACLGCCTLAPVIQIDETTYGRLTPQMVKQVLHDFSHRGNGAPRRARVKSRIAEPAGEIRVGLGSCCVAQGSGDVYRAMHDILAASGAPANLTRVGCVGMCHQTPLVEMVQLDGQTSLYAKVKPEHARDMVLKHFRPRGLSRRIGYTVSRLLDRFHTDEEDVAIERHSLDVRETPVCAFLGPQKRLATEHCSEVDPLDLDAYRARGGFAGLQRCLSQLRGDQIVEEIRASGLRGRGGAGFPTHIKWDKVRTAGNAVRYVICNGDEGDPGAFMDRMLLESVPYRVIEGMAIAARAVGAHDGFFYIRAEYPLAVRRVREALQKCEQQGVLGDSVMGSDFRLHLSVKEGAGAFVCGEETALINSLEGQRGTPRIRPPYPAEVGFRGKPTLINNVETFALVPWILRNGAQPFAALGTAKSKGTKVFALAGKVVRGGLIEVPMGVTLREIVHEIGGGVLPGRTFKAVQVGGPSGGCVPAELADTPVDYEALSQVGAIMGSGGLVVLDDTDCMVDMARYFLRFTQDQSCGKCTFCRIGTRRMLDVMDRICAGRGRSGDLEQLEQLACTVGAGSLCGLGKTAPNPVLSTLKYFRDEYEAHLKGHCPAGRCMDLISYRINPNCIGCTLCAQHCPVDAIAWTPYRKHEIDMDKCTRCDTCRQVCPEDAVQVV